MDEDYDQHHHHNLVVADSTEMETRQDSQQRLPLPSPLQQQQQHPQTQPETTLHPTNRRLKNSELTLDDKILKHQLKRHLKQKIRIRKFHVRWTLALERKDTLVAIRACHELQTYLQALQVEQGSVYHQPDYYQQFLHPLQEQIRDYQQQQNKQQSMGSTPVPQIAGSGMVGNGKVSVQGKDKDKEEFGIKPSNNSFSSPPSSSSSRHTVSKYYYNKCNSEPTVEESTIVIQGRAWISHRIWQPLVLQIRNPQQQQQQQQGRRTKNPAGKLTFEDPGIQLSTKVKDGQVNVDVDMAPNEPHYEPKVSVTNGKTTVNNHCQDHPNHSPQHHQQQQQQRNDRIHPQNNNSSNNNKNRSNNNKIIKKKSEKHLVTKQTQTQQARTLLQHMAKGTQKENMFDNDQALIGYTRQKFMERAILAMKSLDRLLFLQGTQPPLSPPSLSLPYGNDCNSHGGTATVTTTTTTINTTWWKRLRQVRQVLSIGCGPGCDAVGILAFLKHLRQISPDEIVSKHSPSLDPQTTSTSASSSSSNKKNENDHSNNNDDDDDKNECKDEDGDDDDEKPYILDRIILMDYVMPQWKRLVVDALIPLLTTTTTTTTPSSSSSTTTTLSTIKKKTTGWVQRIDTCSCDVRYSLCHDERNRLAWTTIQDSTPPPVSTTTTPTTAVRTRSLSTSKSDSESLFGQASSSSCSSSSNNNTNNTNEANNSSQIDLVVVSYLLTETRHQWHSFFKDLLQYLCESSSSSCLILLSEPTAWQLHHFLDRFHHHGSSKTKKDDDNEINNYHEGNDVDIYYDYIEDYQWLDSSRDFPDLQDLDGRMGPAVLLLQTKPRRKT